MRFHKKINKTHHIYTITNVLDNSIYVGKSSNPEYRWKVHQYLSKKEKKRTTHFYRALYQYGCENFSLKIVSSHENEIIAYTEESSLIVQLKNQNFKLYNENEGGRGGHSNPSDELRERLSNSRIGEKHPLFGKPGTRLGMKNSPESIEKFKLTVKNKLYGRVGNVVSEQTKKLWSTQRKNKPYHGKKPLTKIQKDEIINMFNDNFSAKEISKHFDCCISTVHKIIKKHLTTLVN